MAGSDARLCPSPGRGSLPSCFDVLAQGGGTCGCCGAGMSARPARTAPPLRCGAVPGGVYCAGAIPDPQCGAQRSSQPWRRVAYPHHGKIFGESGDGEVQAVSGKREKKERRAICSRVLSIHC
ncbi:hypothetical protein GQ55_3G390100 [Panicum hallii var. hallii]|uniref:Uncharacterized protein n=1 Tax=Panicum hallii var. hallii TaxID=1504633 RepID=A0A2T7EGJ2_9POAL|nr:hypothetical protein GQ55_3G390100 [Panicum hallii var. hallii]PUZ66945.1 hypothetical protein GQ55_3G390100 [Panicum hallii var. hallii]